MKKFKEFMPLWRFIKEDRRKVITLVAILFVTSLSSIFTGYLIGYALECITKKKLSKALISLLLYFLNSILIEHGLRLGARKELEKVESKISRKLCYEAYNKVLNLPARAFEEKTSGEIINRVSQDATSLSFVFGRVVRIISAIIMTFVLFFYIAYNSYYMAIEIVLILGLLYLLLKKYNPLMKEAHKFRKSKQDIQTSLVTESVRGIREIKTLGIKKNLLKEGQKNVKAIDDGNIKEIKLDRDFNIIGGFLRTLMEVGVFVTGAIQLYYGQITITFFIAMTYYVYRYTWLMEEINDFTIEYQKLNVSLGRVNELLENRLYDDVKYGMKNLKNSQGILEFKDVKFAYPNEPVTLDGFNLRLEPNKKIAIVGKSGQGKSTLFNLVTRIFDVNEGKILLDGINIKDLTESSLNKNISIIRQDPFIFNRTIKENFKLINENIKLSEIRKYTKMAYLDEYIMSLPKKYDTVLGEGGVNLSGGQKQRLAIARTLAKESKVILFDEATSALDNNSQEFIDADVIYVVEHGKIVDSGTHEELLKKSKIYNKLYLSENSDSK